MVAEEAVVEVASVVINTTNEENLANFWSRLLGVEIGHRVPGFIWLRRQRAGGYSIAFQHVDEPTPGRRRLHLDTSVADIDEATAKIIELGGAQVEDHEVGGFRWRVMADPDGNEFCIARHD